MAAWVLVGIGLVGLAVGIFGVFFRLGKWKQVSETNRELLCNHLGHHDERIEPLLIELKTDIKWLVKKANSKT